jgi:hypothetical protein
MRKWITRLLLGLAVFTPLTFVTPTTAQADPRGESYYRYHAPRYDYGRSYRDYDRWYYYGYYAPRFHYRGYYYETPRYYYYYGPYGRPLYDAQRN